MRTIVCIASSAVVAVALAASNAQAQDSRRISLEGRLGVTFPSGDVSDAGGGSGYELGADFMYTFTPALTGYIGVSRHSFSCDEDEGPCEDSFASSGFQAGLKYLFSREGRALPWLRAGLLGQSLDVGPEDSDFGLGLEAGAGLDVDVSHRLALVPAFYYRTYSADVDGGGDVSVNWFSLTLAAHLHF